MTETTLVREDSWPAGLRVAQVRVARPTDKLAEVEEFYASHLGLPVLYRFVDHDGFDGVMLIRPAGSITSSSPAAMRAAHVRHRHGRICSSCTSRAKPRCMTPSNGWRDSDTCPSTPTTLLVSTGALHLRGPRRLAHRARTQTG